MIPNDNRPTTEVPSTDVLKRLGMVCHCCGAASTRLWASPDEHGDRVCVFCYAARWGNPFRERSEAGRT